MKSRLLIVILFLLAGTAVWADDPISIVERMLNPESRFKLYELQINGGFEVHGMGTLKGTYTISKGVKSFAIDDLVAERRLIIDVDEKGKATPRLAPLNQENHDQAGVPITVSLNDGMVGPPGESYEKRVEANKGVPTIVVFGVYWDMNPSGMGADTVEYGIAYRTDPSGPITVINCLHDLRGTAIEAPWEAAANVAAGALLADVNRLQEMTSRAALLLDGAKEGETKDAILRDLQPSMDAAILEIEKLSHYTKRANSMLALQSKTVLAQGKGLAEFLQQLRNPKLAETDGNSGDSAKIKEIFAVWAANGIPFNTNSK